ncbi:MAG: hypothetical protein KJP00_01035, partial [Bacteroidia bacterium]|nr:hypothetical protein [Bacteroidia bacterium]
MNTHQYILRIFVVVLLFLIPFLCCSQEQLGLRMDNYQGIHSVFLNPANAATQELGWNLNLIAAGAFVENNYAFLKNTSFLKAINSNIVYASDVPPDWTPEDGEVVLDFNEMDSKKFVDFNGFITGPSFLAHLNEHHFGVFINYRFHGAEQDLDQDLGYYTNSNIPLGQPFDVDRTQFAAMLWREIGIHYSYSKATYFGEISIGTNLKYLNGLEGLVADSKQISILQRIALEELEAVGVDAEIIATSPVLDQDNIADQSRGNGLGMDFGISAIFRDYEDSYRLKIGLAVNDLGKITFDNAVEAHVFQSLNDITFFK